MNDFWQFLCHLEFVICQRQLINFDYWQVIIRIQRKQQIHLHISHWKQPIIKRERFWTPKHENKRLIHLKILPCRHLITRKRIKPTAIVTYRTLMAHILSYSVIRQIKFLYPDTLQNVSSNVMKFLFHRECSHILVLLSAIGLRQ